MNQRMQGIIIGLVIGSLCTGGSVIARNAAEQITVNYRDIKILKDEVACTLKDANGNFLEPFIYNGTTYLPVRPVAELAGMDVTWDNATSTIHLWAEKTSAEGKKMLSVCPPTDTSIKCRVYLPDEGKSFAMNGVTYTDGLVFEKSAQSAQFNLDYKYTTLTFTVGHVDGSEYTGTDKISVSTNNRILKECTIRPTDAPQTFTVSVKDLKNLDIRVIGDNNPTRDSVVGIGDIRVQKQ